MKKLLIVNVGSAPDRQLNKFGDFELWAKQAIGSTKLEVEFHDGINQPLPSAEMLAGVIIMGSLSMVTEELTWMKRLAKEIIHLEAQNVPMLGICFGHQLICYAFGGKVGFNPKGLEVGTIQIQRLNASDSDPIFNQLPHAFSAQAVHYQSVLQLPEQGTRLAESNLDKHHAFRVGASTWGVQFHPEFSQEIMLDTLDNFEDELGSDGVIDKKNKVDTTLNAQQVLVNFNQYCTERLN